MKRGAIMSKKDSKKQRPAEELPERWPHDVSGNEDMEDMAVFSANECTGLIPASPSSDAAAASYGDIYGIPLPTAGRDNNIGEADGTKINSAKNM